MSGLPPPQIPELQRHSEVMAALRSISVTLVTIAFLIGLGVALFAVWLLGVFPDL